MGDSTIVPGSRSISVDGQTIAVQTRKKRGPYKTKPAPHGPGTPVGEIRRLVELNAERSPEVGQRFLRLLRINDLEMRETFQRLIDLYVESTLPPAGATRLSAEQGFGRHLAVDERKQKAREMLAAHTERNLKSPYLRKLAPQVLGYCAAGDLGVLKQLGKARLWRNTLRMMAVLLCARATGDPAL